MLPVLTLADSNDASTTTGVTPSSSDTPCQTIMVCLDMFIPFRVGRRKSGVPTPYGIHRLATHSVGCLKSALIDYRAMGGIDGRFPEVKAWLAQVLPNFPAYGHMLGNFDVRIDRDTASSRTICFNPMVLGGDQNQILFCGLWYEDEFVRTPEGWRMNSRVETKCFDKVV